MNEISDKYELVKKQVVINLANEIGIEKNDANHIADEINEWMNEDEREQTKTVTTEGWMVIAKYEAENLSVVGSESTNIIPGTSVVQPQAKTFKFSVSLE